MANKHGWNDHGDYLHVLRRVLDDHPFVIENTITITPSPDGGLVSGDAICHGDVVVKVHKRYEIRIRSGREQARTVRYSYHARYKGGRSILRYDNAPNHGEHPTRNHKHDFRARKVTHVGENWPHLSEVLGEVMGIVWH